MLGKRRKKEEKWRDFETEAMPLLPDLYRVAVWLTKDKTEAEDLVQETFFQALKSFNRYKTGTNCRAWLMTIMYHMNAKRLQKLGQLQMLDETEDILAETIALEPSIPQKLTDEEVITALRSVPENFRQVVILSDVEGFSYKEIAAILGVPIGTVMSRLARGRRILRQQLAAYARRHGFGDDHKQVAR
jgi:RNA polymerase sigma-70 factor (ECF subfamily)